MIIWAWSDQAFAPLENYHVRTRRGDAWADSLFGESASETLSVGCGRPSNGGSSWRLPVLLGKPRP